MRRAGGAERIDDRDADGAAVPGVGAAACGAMCGEEEGEWATATGVVAERPGPAGRAADPPGQAELIRLFFLPPW
jgi:hypothetical protein